MLELMRHLVRTSGFLEVGGSPTDGRCQVGRPIHVEPEVARPEIGPTPGGRERRGRVQPFAVLDARTPCARPDPIVRTGHRDPRTVDRNECARPRPASPAADRCVRDAHRRPRGCRARRSTSHPGPRWRMSGRLPSAGRRTMRDGRGTKRHPSATASTARRRRRTEAGRGERTGNAKSPDSFDENPREESTSGGGIRSRAPTA